MFGEYVLEYVFDLPESKSKSLEYPSPSTQGLLESDPSTNLYGSD